MKSDLPRSPRRVSEEKRLEDPCVAGAFIQFLKLPGGSKKPFVQEVLISYKTHFVGLFVVTLSIYLIVSSVFMFISVISTSQAKYNVQVSFI